MTGGVTRLRRFEPQGDLFSLDTIREIRLSATGVIIQRRGHAEKLYSRSIIEDELIRGGDVRDANGLLMEIRPIIPAITESAGVIDDDEDGEQQQECDHRDSDHAATAQEQRDVVSRRGHDTK